MRLHEEGSLVQYRQSMTHIRIQSIGQGSGTNLSVFVNDAPALALSGSASPLRQQCAPGGFARLRIGFYCASGTRSANFDDVVANVVQ
jgi:hypothetical protein